MTRKITWHAAAIKLGLRDHIALGNLDAKRDWGYAKDYVEAMWLMLQQDAPDDFVIATGETNTVRRCVEVAFDQAGIPNWEDYVRIDDQFKRPAEVDLLVGDHTKATEQLGWTPATSFEQLIRLMVDADLKLLGLTERWRKLGATTVGWRRARQTSARAKTDDEAARPGARPARRLSSSRKAPRWAKLVKADDREARRRGSVARKGKAADQGPLGPEWELTEDEIDELFYSD